MLKENQFYKILVVEDNLGDFVLLEDYINEYFLRIEIINPKSYIEFEKTIASNNDFDIIFLDLTLPDKTGIDLIKACTDLVNYVPIVVLTGYPDFKLAVQSLSIGVSDYLLKEDLSPATIHKCIIYNIERHKNISKIKESEQYYFDLFQFSKNPLIVYEQESEVILDVNAAAITTYQYDLETFLEKKIDEIKTENYHCIVNSENLPINDDPKFSLNNIDCHKKKNGELLYVSTSSNKIIYKGTPSIILSIEDLTKEIKYIQSIQIQNDKFKEIAWMQSHVVRAPLARIMGLIDLLMDNFNDELERKAIVEMVMDSSKELDDIIREIVSKTNHV